MRPDGTPNYTRAVDRTFHSPFHQTACSVIYERACDYVMWLAGHGADEDTLNSYLSTVRVFRSHFAEWANGLTRPVIVASIPTIANMMPGLCSGTQRADPVPVPPVVSAVVAFALQQHIMCKEAQLQRAVAVSGWGTPSLSGLHAPIIEAAILGAALGRGKQ